MTFSEHPLFYHLQLITFDDMGRLSGTYKQRIFSNGAATIPPVVGLAVGRFDPPKQGESDDLDQQIALVYQANQSSGTTRSVWSVSNTWQFNQISSDLVAPTFNIADVTYPGFGEITGGLFDGDAQGRSARLGAPIKVTLQGHIQPDLVLGIPPMHIDYIRDANGNGPKTINFTVLPSSDTPAFNTQFAFSSESSTKHEESSTTDVATSIGGELKRGTQVRL